MHTIRPRHINLMTRNPRPVWPLQAALAVVVVTTIGMGWSLWGPRSTQGNTASIGSLVGTPTETEPQHSLTPASAPEAISEVPVTGTALGLESDTVRFYEEKTGRAFQVRLRDGLVLPLSDTALQNFVTSFWVPGLPEVISKFDDGSSVEHIHYNFATDTSSPVGGLVTSLAVSPDGRSVVYAQASAGKTDIMIANADGVEPRLLVSTRALDTVLAWPNTETIAVSWRRVADGAKDLVLLSPDGLLTPLFTGLMNLEFSWSRGGAHLLYSSYEEEAGVTLRLHSFEEGTDIGTGLQTSAAKCAWAPDGASFVCGVPSSAALSRDVPAELTATNDSLVRVERSTLTSEILYRAAQRPLFSVSRPLLSSSSVFFVFTNLFDRKLYSFSL